MKKKVKVREYLLNTQRINSIITLIACLVCFSVSIYALCLAIVTYYKEGYPFSELFEYFTTLINVFNAVSSAFIMPYAIEGIRKKHFTYPRWMSLMHFAGTSSIAFVFVFTVGFIAPYNIDFAFGGSNFYFHVVTPIQILISYFFVECNYKYTKRDYIICFMPFFLYSLVYLYEVVILTQANGGWEDLYLFNTILPFYISMPICYVFYFILAVIIRNIVYLTNERRKKRLLKAWNDDTDPLEIKIDVYGLGNHYGYHNEDNGIDIPYDLLKLLSEKYSIDLNELLNVFNKGLAAGLKDSQNKKRNKYSPL